MGRINAYRRGIDAWTMLQDVRKKTRVTTAKRGEPQNIAGRIDDLTKSLRWLQQGRLQPDSELEKQEYEAYIKPYEEAINHLENLARNSMMDCCLRGVIVGFGYAFFGDRFPWHIAPCDWAFLEIDFNDSSAKYNSTEYGQIKFHAIRFLWASEISIEERKCIKLETEHELSLVDEEESIKNEKNDSTKALKKRNRKVGITIAITTAHKRLLEKYGREPTSEEVFNHLESSDETGCIVDGKPGILVWVDSKGKQHETRLKTIANTLGRIRSRP